MQINRWFISTIVFICLCQLSFAQQKQDTLIVSNDSLQAIKTGKRVTTADTIVKKQHSPRKAALRSALIPGWGQAYNKKYWKIPFVYAALGTTGYVFKYNLDQYRRISFAYRVLVQPDTARFKEVDADLQPFITQNASNALRNYRNEFRRNIDYSVLVFLLFWGLNVVDATVDAHLKGFDVSSDISLYPKPGFNPATGTTGLSLVFDIHKGKPRKLSVIP
jgi:hypothetical protein